MRDYDFTGVFVFMGIVAAVIGAAVMAIVIYLINHLSVTVRWA